MVRTFRHKGLRELFETGTTRRINRSQHRRCRQQLDAIHAAETPGDLDLPGWRLHKLRGYACRYSLTVTANYRIIFDFKDNDAFVLDYEDYH